MAERSEIFYRALGNRSYLRIRNICKLMPGVLHEIVLTGGPCSGKTTALCHLEEGLQNKGYRVFSVPEVATRFIRPGIPDISEIVPSNQELYLEIQRNILLSSFEERQRYRQLSQLFVDQGDKVIIIYDRGIMDGQAYLDHRLFASLLEEEKIAITEARDSYHGIFHLVTAADGAEEFYTLDNNTARTETAELARELDRKTQQAWIGAPHLRIIDNSTDFEKKIKRLEQAAHRVLGIPVSLEIERKYLLAEIPALSNLGSVQTITIEQMYLVQQEGRELRIRKRSQDGSSLYYLTHKKKLKPGVRIETEERISSREYLKLTLRRDPQTEAIQKLRHCFVYQGQYFELDQFIEPKRMNCLSLLEIELTEEQDQVILPPEIKVVREVTADPKFSNRSLATKSWKFD